MIRHPRPWDRLIPAALVLLVALAAAASAAPTKVILDSDGDADYDDVVGVMMAAVSPELDVVGAVATGRDAERRARAVAQALAVVGRDDVGVHLGEVPISPEPSFPYMSQFPPRRYGFRPELEKWAADVAYHPPATSGAELYLEQVVRAPGEISVIVTGPLSTLGRAMQLADERGQGEAFRRGIKQVLFSGGDFDTVEYNVYCDVGAARLLFASRIPIWEFPGEGAGKAYFQHAERERLWHAETPATWALLDLYHFWRAGWDPTSPFVPILYDVHPAAFLIAGEEVSRFSPAHVDVDDDGRLVRAAGTPNAQVRVSNSGDRLIELVLARLGSGTEPALNHLRAAERMAEPSSHVLAARLEATVGHVARDRHLDREAVAALFDPLEPALGALGEDAAAARAHLAMARRFLLGEPRPDAWHDPYTPRWVTFVMFPFRTYAVLVSHRIAAGVLAIVTLAVLAVLVRSLVPRLRRGAA